MRFILGSIIFSPCIRHDLLSKLVSCSFFLSISICLSMSFAKHTSGPNCFFRVLHPVIPPRKLREVVSGEVDPCVLGKILELVWKPLRAIV